MPSRHNPPLASPVCNPSPASSLPEGWHLSAGWKIHFVHLFVFYVNENALGFGPCNPTKL